MVDEEAVYMEVRVEEGKMCSLITHQGALQMVMKRATVCDDSLPKEVVKQT